MYHGPHAFGVFFSADASNVSLFRNIMGPGFKWRMPNISLNQASPGVDDYNGPLPPEHGRYVAESVQNLMYHGMFSDVNVGQSSIDPVDIFWSQNLFESGTQPCEADRHYGAWCPTSGGTPGWQAWALAHGGTGWFGVSQSGVPTARAFVNDNWDNRYRPLGVGDECQSFSRAPNGTRCNVSYEQGYGGVRAPMNAYPAWGGGAALRTTLIAETGPLRPCRDWIDEFVIDLVNAGEGWSMEYGPWEYGWDKSLPVRCAPTPAANANPSVSSPTVNVSAGATISTWSATCTDGGDGPGRSFCRIKDAGTIDARIENPGGASDGTCEGTFDVTGKPAGNYPFEFYCYDGVLEDRQTGTVTVVKAP
jgi:hypothetical protein